MGGTNYNFIVFGKDASGKRIVLGLTSRLGPDRRFADGTASSWGKGSVALDPAGGIHVVDGDGYWQSVTATTASPSASASRSPSASASPSSSVSPSVSPSSSVSPSVSPSPSRSVSPSASASPSA